MHNKVTGSNKLDTVLHGVTFYSRSLLHAGTYVKTVPNVQMKAATHAGSSLGLHGGCVDRKKQSERYTDHHKSEVGERRPKSIECVRLTTSKGGAVRKQKSKPKYSLLPYKRGQLKCIGAENVIIRNAALNSEVEKENKMKSDDSSGTAIAGKPTVRNGTSRRFFKASFSKRRPFTLSVCGLTASHLKLNHLKWRARNTADGNKHLCVNSSSVCSEPQNEQTTAEVCSDNENYLATSYESLCDDVMYKNIGMAVESIKADAESDNSHTASDTNCAVSNNYCSSADVEKHSDITNTSDTMDHSSASVDLSTPKMYFDNAATRPDMKHGNQKLIIVFFVYFF